MYISSAFSISNQTTITGLGQLGELVEVHDESTLVEPEYTDIIQPRMLRRMSKVLKMGVFSGLKALQIADVQQPDAIITATGLGCLQDTIKFLDDISDEASTILSPTPFIQSTHNTVGGQIALATGSQCYNMTYVQQGLSFENALLDAELALLDGPRKQVLVGGVDEYHEFLDHSKEILLANGGHALEALLSQGANFFVLTGDQSQSSLAQIQHTNIYHSAQDLSAALHDYDIQLVLTDRTFSQGNSGLPGDLFPNAESVPYKQYCGEFFSASGFAVYLATEILNNPGLVNFRGGQIMVLNEFLDNIGVTILSSCEV